jgi:hypothetical protein
MNVISVQAGHRQQQTRHLDAYAVGQSAVTARCHCGHESHEHDSVAARYCTATATWIIDRGCICRPLPPRPWGCYNR